MKKVLAAVALVAILVSAASAQQFNEAVIRTDANGLWITNTFPVGEGTWVKNKRYYTSMSDTCLASPITINPTSPTPGWLILTVPPEANLTRIWVQFYEAVAGSSSNLTYALGDTIPIYVGGLYRQEPFNVGLWDYCKVWSLGSVAGKCDIYWRTECYGN